LGVIDHVSSPTFSLLNCYHTTPGSDFDQVVHIDLYRISTEEEAYRAGIEEYFYSNAPLSGGMAAESFRFITR